MNLKTIAAAAIFTVAAAGANAAVSLDETFDLGNIDNKSASWMHDMSISGSFVDTIKFELGGVGSVDGGVARFASTIKRNVTFASLVLTGGTIAGSWTATDPSDFAFSGLGAGTYTFTLQGNATGTKGGVYGGDVYGTVAVVPEPETLALMLAGIGAVGFMVRRRNAG